MLLHKLLSLFGCCVTSSGLACSYYSYSKFLTTPLWEGKAVVPPALKAVQVAHPSLTPGFLFAY
ncbi:hypothetical protein SAMN05216436_105196 [bacterium A37T11]|nr:hypothetical protein SAMN05216436_105196 [bacterium A37T11]